MKHTINSACARAFVVLVVRVVLGVLVISIGVPTQFDPDASFDLGDLEGFAPATVSQPLERGQALLHLGTVLSLENSHGEVNKSLAVPGLLANEGAEAFGTAIGIARNPRLEEFDAAVFRWSR